MPAKGTTNSPPRRSREDWLDTALEVLEHQGGQAIRIRSLCRTLRVTTGSFYAHFKGRDDFLRCLVVHWKEKYTTAIVHELHKSPADARSRLVALAEAIISRGLGRFDLAVRSWASHEPVVAQVVRRVDRERLELVRRLFEKCGFSGDDCDMRARTFVTYYTGELLYGVVQSKRKRLEEAEKRIELLIRPAAPG